MKDNRGARLQDECEVDDGGRGRLRLERPCETEASEIAGEVPRVAPVCARGRGDKTLGRARLSTVGLADDALEVILLVRCLEENVDPNSEVEELVTELDIGPETERLDEAIDNRLELRGVPVLTEGPEAARRALGAGRGGTRNLPGDAESLEKLPFLSRLWRGRAASRLALTRGLSLAECEELLMTEARLLRPELITLAGRDFCPLMRSSAIASSSVQV